MIKRVLQCPKCLAYWYTGASTSRPLPGQKYFADVPYDVKAQDIVTNALTARQEECVVTGVEQARAAEHRDRIANHMCPYDDWTLILQTRMATMLPEPYPKLNRLLGEAHNKYLGFKEETVESRETFMGPLRRTSCRPQRQRPVIVNKLVQYSEPCFSSSHREVRPLPRPPRTL